MAKVLIELTENIDDIIVRFQRAFKKANSEKITKAEAVILMMEKGKDGIKALTLEYEQKAEQLKEAN